MRVQVAKKPMTEGVHWSGPWVTRNHWQVWYAVVVHGYLLCVESIQPKEFRWRVECDQRYVLRGDEKTLYDAQESARDALVDYAEQLAASVRSLEQFVPSGEAER